MRLARNLLLSGITALAAMVFMATAVFGQSIELDDELNAEHCSDVIENGHSITGGCEVHATSEDLAATFAHTGSSEVVTSTCGTELTGHGGSGGGYIAVDDTSILTNPGTGCVVTPCDESGGGGGGSGPHPELEWPISSLFEFGGGNEAMILTFCIRPFNTAEGVGNTPCTIILDIIQTEHAQEFTANEEPCFENAARELSGHWLTEPADSGNETDIELEHIHYPGD